MYFKWPELFIKIIKYENIFKYLKKESNRYYKPFVEKMIKPYCKSLTKI